MSTAFRMYDHENVYNVQTAVSHSLDSVEHLALHAMLNFLTTDHQLQHFVHCMLRVFLQ